ncbi:MAG: hypothetical protein ACI358_07665, partial [Candidatus Limimorpha sp.]
PKGCPSCRPKKTTTENNKDNIPWIHPKGCPSCRPKKTTTENNKYNIPWIHPKRLSKVVQVVVLRKRQQRTTNTTFHGFTPKGCPRLSKLSS